MFGSLPFMGMKREPKNDCHPRGSAQQSLNGGDPQCAQLRCVPFLDPVRASVLRTRQRDDRSGESGNALIYVLVAIALFAALSFTLGRQSDTSEVGSLSDEKNELYATQIISYAAQAKQVIDQMDFIGTLIGDLDFVLPSDAAFNTAPHVDKVFHPEGGGLIPGNLPKGSETSAIIDPVAGWYLGRFNNVEWTTTTGTDVILTAYQISQAVCEKINEKLTGSTAISTMTDSIKEVMIDDAFYGAGTNTDLTTDGGDICPACNNMAMLCVENQSQNAFAFYAVLADR